MKREPQAIQHPAAPATNPTAWAGMAALALLLVQAALYAWMAPRGFDFTDESFYLNNFLHWRDFTGTVTFFGAYFEWPFRALGMSLAGIRVFSLVLILATAAVLMREVLRFAPGAGVPAGRWVLAAPMASAMLYFGFMSTLRAPSYNLLTMCSMAFATAFLLRTVARHGAGAAPRAAPFLYGVALGACLLSKATTAVILVGMHALFVAVANRSWQWKKVVPIGLLAAAGVALNFVLLTLEFRGWPGALREGVAIMAARGGYGMGQMLRALAWELQAMLVHGGMWLALAAVATAALRRPPAAHAARTVSLLVPLIAGANAVAVGTAQNNPAWLPAMTLTVIALWRLERLARPAHAAGPGRAELALTALLMLMPLAFSFGTNTPVLVHSASAAMFCYCALYLRLYRLAWLGLLGRRALAASVVLLCLPALAVQVLALTDVHHVYRQRSALGRQDAPLVLGTAHATVLVDPRIRDSLRALSERARAAGLRPGQDVLDFSGDGPGVIYALGANPLGTAWMIGGYQGSAAGAQRVLDKLDQLVLRRAWLLTSTTNPRRIPGWEAMLARRIGPGSHTLAATVDMAAPYSWGPQTPASITLQLWRPAAAAGPQQ